MTCLVISSNRQPPFGFRSRNFVLTLRRRSMIIPICVDLLLGFIKSIKYFLSFTPPKATPYLNKNVLHSGFSGRWVFYVSASYIYIRFPAFDLESLTALAQYDFSWLLPNWGSYIEVPTINIPNFRIIDINGLISR